MQSKAFLFDPNAQKLSGTLFLTKDCLTFVLDDFPKSSLQWILQLADIQEVIFYKIYNIANAGIHIFSKNGKEDVFILENAEQWMKLITMNNGQ
jgi:hypothetical protein